MKSRMLRACALAAVALAGALQPGCRPAEVSRPGPPGGEGPPGVAAAPPRAADPGEAEVLVGRYCPDAARGRPGVRPLFALADRWIGDEAWLARLTSRGAVRQLSVLAWDGRRAGVMSAAGAASEGGQSVLVGSYAGSSPCAGDAPLGEEPEDDPMCVRALAGCGVAVAHLEAPAGGGARPFGEDAPPADVTSGEACVAGDQLVVDLDGRGAAGFSLAQFGEGGAPPSELSVSAGDAPACEPAFASVAVVGDVRVDVLAVADLDGSGRAEVLVAVGEGADRAWALYSATKTPKRLDRVAVARP